MRVLWSTFFDGPKQKLNLISPKENAEQTQESYLVNNVALATFSPLTGWMQSVCREMRHGIVVALNGIVSC